MNLLARAVFYKETGNHQTKALIQAAVKDGENFISKALPPFKASLAPVQVSYPQQICQTEPSDPITGQDGPSRCWVILDGQKTQIFDGLGAPDRAEYDQIVADLVQSMNAARKHVIDSVEEPVNKAVTQWEAAAARVGAA